MEDIYIDGYNFSPTNALLSQSRAESLYNCTCLSQVWCSQTRTLFKYLNSTT